MIVIGFIAAIVVPVFMDSVGCAPAEKSAGRICRADWSFRTKRAKRDADLWNYANTFFSHMILVAGVNGGLVSSCLLHRVYDFDRRSVLGGRGGFASLCSGGVCIVSLSNYGFSRQKNVPVSGG